MPEEAPLMEQKWYTPAQLAGKLGVSIRTLDDWRLDGKGPPFIRVSYRAVMYAFDDVEKWLQSLRREARHDEFKRIPRAGAVRPVALPVQSDTSKARSSHQFGRHRTKSEVSAGISDR